MKGLLFSDFLFFWCSGSNLTSRGPEYCRNYQLTDSCPCHRSGTDFSNNFKSSWHQNILGWFFSDPFNFAFRKCQVCLLKWGHISSKLFIPQIEEKKIFLQSVLFPLFLQVWQRGKILITSVLIKLLWLPLLSFSFPNWYWTFLNANTENSFKATLKENGNQTCIFSVGTKENPSWKPELACGYLLVSALPQYFLCFSFHNSVSKSY